MGAVVIGISGRTPDLTVEQDEMGGVGPRIEPLDRMDEDQEHLASESESTSGGVIDDTCYRDGSTGGFF